MLINCMSQKMIMLPHGLEIQDVVVEEKGGGGAARLR